MAQPDLRNCATRCILIIIYLFFTFKGNFKQNPSGPDWAFFIPSMHFSGNVPRIPYTEYIPFRFSAF